MDRRRFLRSAGGLLLSLAWGAQAQMSVYRRPIASVSYDSAAQAIFDVMTTPPDATRKGVINTCVVALKAAGVWSKLDALWMLAAADSQAARINWVNPGETLLAPQSSPTFTTDRGYTGNASNMYLKGPTSFTSMSQYSQNSAHLSAWNRTAGVGANFYGNLIGGELAVSSHSAILAHRNDDVTTGNINDGNIGGVVDSNSIGHWIANRSGASAGQLYKNGSSVATGSGASVAVDNVVPAILMSNYQFADQQVAMGSVGSSLNSTEAAAFYSAIAAYMTAVGA